MFLFYSCSWDLEARASSLTPYARERAFSELRLTITSSCLLEEFWWMRDGYEMFR